MASVYSQPLSNPNLSFLGRRSARYFARMFLDSPEPLSRADMTAPAANIEAAFQIFVKANSAFESTKVLDDMRASDYGRLDRLAQVFLDYTGGGLYADSQIRHVSDLLEDGTFGNPHSDILASSAPTELVEETRESLFKFFHAPPGKYVAIFTPNATRAIKLVGEAYPFQAGDRYLLSFDNHNSINGVREFARANGADVTYVPVVPPDLRMDAAQLKAELYRPNEGGHNLFSYPAQFNFSGGVTPTGLDDICARKGLGRPAGLPGLRSLQPPGPGQVATRFCAPVLLQDVRLPNRCQVSAGPEERAGQAGPVLVRRGHSHHRFSPIREALSA